MIFQLAEPSRENLRWMMMEGPYSAGLYASGPWFLSLMVTVAVLELASDGGGQGECDVNCA